MIIEIITLILVIGIVSDKVRKNCIESELKIQKHKKRKLIPKMKFRLW